MSCDGQPYLTSPHLTLYVAQPVGKETGNTKVFCQNPANYEIAAYATLAEPMKQAVDQMLAAQLK